MVNSTERPENYKIVYGMMFTNKEKEIELPPQNANQIGASALFLNGEMSIKLEDDTVIAEKGKTVARISNKYPKVLVPEGADQNQVAKAVKKYMKEKGITTLDEIVEQNEGKKTNEDKKAEELDRA